MHAMIPRSAHLLDNQFSASYDDSLQRLALNSECKSDKASYYNLWNEHPKAAIAVIEKIWDF